MAPYNESLLLQRLADPASRRDAFAEVVRRFSEPLYWKIRRMVLTHDDADDILQNVFLKAWASLDQFQCRSKVSTWLYRIAINESLDFLRHQKARPTLSSDDDMDVASRLAADEQFDGNHAEALLQEAISLLPDVQRAVFTLRYYDEMKYAEISELMHTSEGALKASYHIAVRKITTFLKEHD